MLTQYDNDGNTLTKVDSRGTRSYTWDFENRLTSVTLPGSGGTVSFKYDPFGRRIYKSSSAATSTYAYDGDTLIEESNSSGTKPAPNIRARPGLQVATAMKNTRTCPFLLAVIACCLWLSSCRQTAKDDCTKHIGQTIRQGDSVEEAQSKLKGCGFKTTLDPKKSMLYGDKVIEGTPVAERTEVVVRFDSNKKVTQVEVGGGLIGP